MRGAEFSLQWLLLSQGTGPRACRLQLLWHLGSGAQLLVAVAHRLSCSVACGILPYQRLSLCLLHWQGHSPPLSHQGSPSFDSYRFRKIITLFFFQNMIIISSANNDSVTFSSQFSYCLPLFIIDSNMLYISCSVQPCLLSLRGMSLMFVY